MVRKLLVRLLNLVYIGAAAYAILCFVTKPLFSLKVNVSVKGEDLAALLPSSDSSDEGGSTTPEPENPGEPKEAAYRLVYREEMDITELLTPEMIAEAVGDIDIPLTIEIPAKKCFELDNKNVLNDIVKENINAVKENLADVLSEKLPGLVKAVTMKFATEVMNEQIQNQINQYFTGEGEAPKVDPEKVDEIVNDVYDLLDSDGTITADNLADAIMGTVSYTLVTDPLTQEDIDSGNYYVKTGNKDAEGNDIYEKATVYEDGTEYYITTAEKGVLGVLSSLSGEEGFEDIDLNDISSGDIQDAMVEALESIPGMTETSYKVAETQPTIETDFGAEEFYVEDGNGGYVRATEYADGTTYYVKEVIITNVDEALAGLLEMFLGGNSSDEDKQNDQQNPGEEPQQGENPTEMPARLVTRAEGEPEPEDEDDSTKQLVMDLIDKLIPFDVDSIDLTLGGYAPYILAALVGLAIFPWALFALVTVIRTIRPRKCWTKPWIVFFFGFLQLIFGVGLTFGIKYGMSALLPLVSGMVPEQYAGLLGGLTLEISTSALIPSFIYLGMIVFTIIYAIFAHGVKKEFKQYKKDKKLAKRAA